MRIAYFGLPLGATLLHADGHALSFAVLSPVSAPGRRRLERQLGAARVIAAREAGPSLEARVAAAWAAQPPGLVVSWFWTRLLPAQWLTAPLGAIGVHPSLLPRHRGPNPYYAAIDAGDRVTGVSVHRLEPSYDTGGVLHQEQLEVGERDAWQLARALDRPSLRSLRWVARRLAEGQSVPERAQDEALATWAPEPSGEALRCDFGWPTERVLRRLRALAPVPGLTVEVAGRAVTLTGARAAPAPPLALLPGEAAVVGGVALIRTGDAAIALSRGTDEATGQPLGEAELAQLIASH